MLNGRNSSVDYSGVVTEEETAESCRDAEEDDALAAQGSVLG